MAIKIEDITINDGPHIQERYPKDMQMPTYDNENPHPDFGKDPNIRNVQGHTEYPKYVTNPETKERVIVNNPAEEEEVTGKGLIEDEDKPKVSKKAAWGK